MAWKIECSLSVWLYPGSSTPQFCRKGVTSTEKKYVQMLVALAYGLTIKMIVAESSYLMDI